MKISFDPKSEHFYPTIKKIGANILGFGSIIALGFISYYLFNRHFPFGSSDYEKHIAKHKECIEVKREEKKYKYSNIQEAINAYDFEVARDYLACHPSTEQVEYERKLKSIIFWWDGFEKSYRNPYKNDLELVVRSEIAYFISQGEFKKAEASAKEANMLSEYEKISGEGFEKILDEMIEKKEFKKIYTFLSNKRSSYQLSKFDLKEDPNDRYCGNLEFNESSRNFNSLLDKVLVMYKYEKVDKNEITAIIELALQELVNSGSGSKLSDVFKKEASIKYSK